MNALPSCRRLYAFRTDYSQRYLISPSIYDGVTGHHHADTSAPRLREKTRGTQSLGSFSHLGYVLHVYPDSPLWQHRNHSIAELNFACLSFGRFSA